MVYFLTVICLIFSIPFTLQLKISVNISQSTSLLTKFWKSTGFSPPNSDTSSVRDYILSKDVNINLALISSLPLQGIEFVRIHWLLSLITSNGDGSINWSSLDQIIERIIHNELKPILELMGNTSLIVKNKSDSRFWRHICTSLLERYIGKYGRYSVSQWKFETWNEPDLKMYNVLNFTTQEFIGYVDGCIDGMKTSLPAVQVGGPAGLFKNKDRHPLCWGFLKHCNASKNRCNLDYISLHKKGNGTASEILRGTLEMQRTLVREYSNLSLLPIVNDESDILTGWWKPEEWRGDARYAAAAIRTIFLFKLHLISSNINRISIDNGFLNVPPNYFNQRTLLTRFVMEGGNMYVQKPIYGAMGLLALLGEEEIFSNIKSNTRSSIFVTCTSNKSKTEKLSLSILVGISSDNVAVNITKQMKLKYKLILMNTWKNARYIIYSINNEQPSPKSVWDDHGSPSVPSKVLLMMLQSVQEPNKIFNGIVTNKVFKKSFAVHQPSITLLHVCKEGVQVPEKIRNVKVYNMSFNAVLITWKEGLSTVRCIKTFIVEHSKSTEEIFIRVNENDIIFNSFNFIYLSSQDKYEQTRGIYRVAAVDYWDRKGEYSDPIMYE